MILCHIEIASSLHPVVTNVTSSMMCSINSLDALTRKGACSVCRVLRVRMHL